jgi:hypothetical protein
MQQTYDPSEFNLVDQKGPNFSKLQLAIPVENFSEALNLEAHTKRVQLMSRTKKITNVGEVHDAMDDTSSGHASFNDKHFQRTGGGAFAQVSKLGMCGITTSAGSGRFTNATPAGGGQLGGLGSNVELTTEKAKKPKKINVEQVRTKLSDTIIEFHAGILKSRETVLLKANSVRMIAEDVKEKMPVCQDGMIY